MPPTSSFFELEYLPYHTVYQPSSIWSLVSWFTVYRRDKRKPPELAGKSKAKSSKLGSGPIDCPHWGNPVFVFHILSYLIKISPVWTHAFPACLVAPCHSQLKVGTFKYCVPKSQGCWEQEWTVSKSHQTYETTAKSSQIRIRSRTLANLESLCMMESNR